jgi:hypothetical protein
MTRNDPRRLADTEIPDLAEMLRDAQRRLPDEAAMQRLSRSLDTALGGPSSPAPGTTPPPDATSFSIGALAKPALLGVLVVAGAGAFLVTKQHENSPTPTPQPAVVESNRPRPLVSRDTPSASSGERTPAPAVEKSPDARPVAPKSTLHQTSRSAQVPAVTELELIAKAERVLRSKPAEALRILEQHARLFPVGHLGQEREVLTIEALARSGQGERARARAAYFPQTYPNSPHAPRVARTLRALGADSAESAPAGSALPSRP